MSTNLYLQTIWTCQKSHIPQFGLEKQYYSGTLRMSQTVIYNMNKNANPVTGAPNPGASKMMINQDRRQAGKSYRSQQIISCGRIKLL